MPLLEWDKSFELGIKQYDEHHMYLVALLNEAYDNFIGGANTEILGAVLDKLIDYATYHFAAEEQWMDVQGYEGLTRHREEYNTFSRRVVEIRNDFHEGKTHLSLEVLIFLKDWLSDHILRTDAGYAPFVAGFLYPLSGPS